MRHYFLFTSYSEASTLMVDILTLMMFTSMLNLLTVILQQFRQRHARFPPPDDSGGDAPRRKFTPARMFLRAERRDAFEGAKVYSQ